MKIKKRNNLTFTIDILILSLLFLISISKNYAVFYQVKNQDNIIGYFKTEAEYEHIQNDIQQTEVDICIKYIFPKVSSQRKIVNKRKINSYNAKQNLLNDTKIIYEFWELTVNNQSYYFKTKDEADKKKNELLNINNKLNVTITKRTENNLDLLNNSSFLNINNFKPIIQPKKTFKNNNKKNSKSFVTTRGSTEERQNKNSNKVLYSYKYISSGYRTKKRPSHTGVDFAALKGTPVHAWNQGYVEFAGYKGNYGNMVIIKHGAKTTRYAHLSKINCQRGQLVSEGEIIGEVGSTGNSTGPHLHFEVMINNSFVNPLNYL